MNTGVHKHSAMVNVNLTRKFEHIGSSIWILVVLILSLLMTGCSGSLSADPTSTPRPTATPTSKPTELPPTETTEPAEWQLEQLPDGRYEFIDEALNFKVIFPKDWIAVSPEDLDLESMQALLSENDPSLAEATGPLISQFPDFARVIAFEDNPEQMALGFLPSIGVVGIKGIEFSILPLEFLTETTVQSTLSAIEQAEVLSSGVDNELWNQPVGRIELQIPIVDESGEAVIIRETLILIQTDDAFITLTLAAEATHFATLDRTIDEVLNDFELTGPPD